MEDVKIENVQLVRNSIREIYGDNNTYYANCLQTASLRQRSIAYVYLSIP